MIRERERLAALIRSVHAAIRDTVLSACAEQSPEELAEVVGSAGGDTIFRIDHISEASLLKGFATIAAEWPCLIVAEGLGQTGRITLPPGLPIDQTEIVIMVDPIDGTRGLMVQKRPAWILTGVAPNRGHATNLSDIEIAVQTEIPLQKQHLCDSLWAFCGAGVRGERLHRFTGQVQSLVIQPSRAKSIAQGFGGISRFFPGARGLLAEIDDALAFRLLPVHEPNRALTFEDQYISTGGQLYELMVGHDRWQADLRALVKPLLVSRNLPVFCCHPYDLCTELIAREAGVLVTTPEGTPLSYPLEVEYDCSWVGFANRTIADQVFPELQRLLREYIPGRMKR